MLQAPSTHLQASSWKSKGQSSGNCGRRCWCATSWPSSARGMPCNHQPTHMRRTSGGVTCSGAGSTSHCCLKLVTWVECNACNVCLRATASGDASAATSLELWWKRGMVVVAPLEAHLECVLAGAQLPQQHTERIDITLARQLAPQHHPASGREKCWVMACVHPFLSPKELGVNAANPGKATCCSSIPSSSARLAYSGAMWVSVPCNKPQEHSAKQVHSTCLVGGGANMP